jgi:hypothetical protein
MLSREDDRATLRQIANLRGYAPTLAAYSRRPMNRMAAKRFISQWFKPSRSIDAPVDARETRAHPLASAHSRSIGLFTPNAPRCIT